MPRISILVAAALASLSLLAATAAPSAARTSESDAWCARVIQIATKHRVMQNEQYLAHPTMRAVKRTVRAALADASALKSLAPRQIRGLQADALTYFAHLVASKFSPATPMAPFSASEATQLVRFQAKRCGISGPWPIPVTGKSH